MYLVAILDWFSRYVLAWELSNTLEAGFCLRAFERALGKARPQIANTDQGSQFTSGPWLGALQAAQVRVSMNGRGRAYDNIFVERLWRSFKYEEVYLRDYRNPHEAWPGWIATMASTTMSACIRALNISRLRPYISAEAKIPQEESAREPMVPSLLSKEITI